MEKVKFEKCGGNFIYRCNTAGIVNDSFYRCADVDENLDEVGQCIDIIDNLLAMIDSPIPCHLHLQGLAGSLPQLRDRLKDAYHALGGEEFK